MIRRSSVLFFLLFACQLAFAQTQAINGSIRGRVIDAAGAVVPSANVTVTNSETGFSRSLDTDDNGLFVFPNLPLGTYTRCKICEQLFLSASGRGGLYARPTEV